MEQKRDRADLTGIHEEAAALRYGAADVLALVGLLLASATVAWMRWGKLYSLVGLDQSWWLGCLSRFVAGELPYRDFLWHYPPLSLALLGYPLRWFGVSFTTVQIIVNLWSAMIVSLLYLILKRFLPPLLNFFAGLLTVAVCATTQSYFGLFYIPNYSQALLTAVIGILLLLLGCLKYLESGRLTFVNGSLMGGGAFVALLSKQESFIAVAGMLAAMAVVDGRFETANPAPGWRLRRFGVLFVVCAAPAIAVYTILGQVVGYANLFAAFRGYGVASHACPWWPTGVGLLGAAAALGCVAVFVALASLAYRQVWKARLAGRYYLLWLMALLGAAAYGAYEFALYGEIILGADSLPRKLSRLAPQLLGSSAFLRPVLWSAILYWGYLLVFTLRRVPELDLAKAQTVLLLTPAVLVSVRSLFGSILSPAPEAPAIAYPFLLALAPVLLLRALTWPYRRQKSLPAWTRQRITAVVALALVTYTAARLVGGYPGMLSDREYTPLLTPAGQVKIKDGRVEAEIYHYVATHTSPGEMIMEIPIGGGISFALGRPNPTFSTIFTQVRTSPEVQQRDLEQFRKRPPAVIVAAARPHYGAVYGIEGYVSCAFPYLRWVPRRAVGGADIVVPVIRYIEGNYRLDRTIGPWALLRPLRQEGSVSR